MSYDFPKPGYVRLNVRCCCTPQKILGTLDLPAGAAKVGKLQFPVAPRDWHPFSGEKPNFSHVTIEIKKFFDFVHEERLEELAVYSDDRPADFWKIFPSFRPMPRVQ